MKQELNLRRVVSKMCARGMTEIPCANFDLSCFQTSCNEHTPCLAKAKSSNESLGSTFYKNNAHCSSIWFLRPVSCWYHVQFFNFGLR